MPRPSLIVLFIAFLLFVAESAARAAIDIKLYGSDGEVGYWLLPSQSGGSLLVGSYSVNSEGFGVSEPFQPTSQNDLILIGDSLVMGTSKLDQHERLGPVLEDLTGWQVWPLSAGSWALANQLRMIDRVSIEGVEAIVFILNAADFGKPAQWRNEWDTPRAEPTLYLTYAIRKKLPGLRGPDEAVPVRQGNPEAEWRRFRAAVQIPVFVIGYEGAATTGENCNWLPAWIDDQAACFDPILRGDRLNMLDPLHLNAKGNESLARFIAANVQFQAPKE